VGYSWGIYEIGFRVVIQIALYTPLFVAKFRRDDNDD